MMNIYHTILIQTLPLQLCGEAFARVSLFHSFEERGVPLFFDKVLY